MKARIKAITELLAPRPLWQDHPGAIPRPIPEAPVAAPRYLIEVESLDTVTPEETARLQVGTADVADLIFPERRGDGCWCEENHQGPGECSTCRRIANPRRTRCEEMDIVGARAFRCDLPAHHTGRHRFTGVG